MDSTQMESPAFARTDNYAFQLLDVLHVDPDRVAIWWKDHPITAGAFAAAIESAACAMHRSGIDSSDVVSVLTVTNSPATLVLRYAVNLICAVVVHAGASNPADPLDRLSLDAQLGILRDTGTTWLAVDEANAERARELGHRLTEPPQLAGFGFLGPDFLDLAAPGTFRNPLATTGDRIAVVTYSSGSTGAPKGIGYSFGVRNQMVNKVVRSAKRTTMLVTAPLTHSSSFLADNALASGGAVVLHETFSVVDVLRAVGQQQVTRLMVSAPQVYALLDHPDLRSADWSSVFALTYTGCPASPSRMAQAAQEFGSKIIQLYGTSECGQITWLTADDHCRSDLLTSVGRPIPPIEICVREPDGDRDLPVGEVGEICVSTPWGMSGYWNDPDLTARTLRDGWFHTGDLGYLDEEGYLYLHGRISDVIKTNGIRVHPETVERVLLTHPDVAQAAVFGVADADAVEHILAAVVLRGGSVTTAAGLREHVSAMLSPKHAPTEFQLLAELPFTRFGKPDKVRLRADAQPSLVHTHGRW